MLKIQEFISCFGSIEEANVYLKKELSLDIKNDSLYNIEGENNIFIYNKGRHSDIDNPLVREANALILDKSHGLLSKGPDHHYKTKDFPKDFKIYKSIAEEMTTGIMITIFNYRGVWVIANKNSINDVDYSIDVKKVIGNGLDSWQNSVFCNKMKKSVVKENYIYVFDFISKEYSNTWPCTTFKLYLLTIIDKKTGRELDPFVVDDISKSLGFVRPKHKMVVGKRSLSAFTTSIRIPSRGIILSNNGIRVKIPNILYYSIKHAYEAKDLIEPIHMAKIFLACNDKIDLMVVSKTFPEYADFLSLFNKTTDTIWRDLIMIWTSIQRFINDPVKFAKAVPPYSLSYLLFMYKNGKIRTFKEGIKKLSPYRLINITKGKYEKEFETNIKQLKDKI